MDPKWTQNGPTMDPQWTQNGPKMDPEWTQNGPKMDPKWTQNGPKMDPKWTQNGPKMDPKWTQNGHGAWHTCKQGSPRSCTLSSASGVSLWSPLVFCSRGFKILKDFHCFEALFQPSFFGKKPAANTTLTPTRICTSMSSCILLQRIVERMTKELTLCTMTSGERQVVQEEKVWLERAHHGMSLLHAENVWALWKFLMGMGQKLWFRQLLILRTHLMLWHPEKQSVLWMNSWSHRRIQVQWRIAHNWKGIQWWWRIWCAQWCKGKLCERSSNLISDRSERK